MANTYGQLKQTKAKHKRGGNIKTIDFFLLFLLILN